MNEQEMYDKVVNHLLTQQCKSFDTDNTSCMYRGANGTTCAIGALVPDSVYDKEMEGLTVEQLLSDFPEVTQYVPDKHIAVLLQSVHDNWEVADWATILKEIGEEYGLDTSVVDKYSV